MATGHAKPQLHPCVANLEAIFAPVGTGSNLADLIEMCALVAHCLLPFLPTSPPSRSGYWHWRPCLLLTASCFEPSLTVGLLTLAPLPSAYCLLPSAFEPSLTVGLLPRR